MAILVTGGAGFIGSHLLEFLLGQTGDSIVSLDDFNDYYSPAEKRANVAKLLEEPRVDFVRGDFCNRNTLETIFEQHDIREVVHLGGIAGVRPSVENPHAYFETNVMGTLTLLEACRGRDLRRFVFASSSTVYGKGAEAPFAEDVPLGAPLSPYGASKKAAESLCETYTALHGIPTVRLRFFSVYGPRLRPDLALRVFAERILAGRPITLFGDGSTRRDFTHVDDICRGIWAAIQTEGIVGQAFNLGNCNPIELREVIAMLERHLGKRAIIHRRDELTEDLPLTHANLTKSRRALTYYPEVSFAAGMAGFCEWILTKSHQTTTPWNGSPEPFAFHAGERAA